MLLYNQNKKETRKPHRRQVLQNKNYETLIESSHVILSHMGIPRDTHMLGPDISKTMKCKHNKVISSKMTCPSIWLDNLINVHDVTFMIYKQIFPSIL